MSRVMHRAPHRDLADLARLAQELREIGDGTETIVLYAMRLESSLTSNVLSLRDQRLLATPVELYMLTHVEMLDLAHNKLKEVRSLLACPLIAPAPLHPAIPRLLAHAMVACTRHGCLHGPSSSSRLPIPPWVCRQAALAAAGRDLPHD